MHLRPSRVKKGKKRQYIPALSGHNKPAKADRPKQLLASLLNGHRNGKTSIEQNILNFLDSSAPSEREAVDRSYCLAEGNSLTTR